MKLIAILITAALVTAKPGHGVPGLNVGGDQGKGNGGNNDGKSLGKGLDNGNHFGKGKGGGGGGSGPPNNPPGGGGSGPPNDPPGGGGGSGPPNDPPGGGSGGNDDDDDGGLPDGSGGLPPLGLSGGSSSGGLFGLTSTQLVGAVMLAQNRANDDKPKSKTCPIGLAVRNPDGYKTRCRGYDPLSCPLGYSCLDRICCPDSRPARGQRFGLPSPVATFGYQLVAKCPYDSPLKDALGYDLDCRSSICPAGSQCTTTTDGAYFACCLAWS